MAIPVTRAGGSLRVLVGRRNPKSRFLGGFFAFPGGAQEPEDGNPSIDGEDAVLRRCATRELEEETGLQVPADAWQDSGRRVTPPFGPRRFDSRMYLAEVPEAVEPAPEDPGELLEMHWETPAELERRWRALEIRIAPPLIPILQELARDEAGSAAELARRLRELNTEMESGGPHIEFVPDVLTVLVATPTLPPATHTNCYLVGRTEFLVIDPGSGSASECERVVRHAERRIASGGRARAVVLTHHHGDHVAGARTVAESLGVPVWTHAETWSRWREGSSLRSADGARDLSEGDALDLEGGERFRVLETPGHAAGHLALFEERQRSLFAGDLVSGVSTILVDSTPGSMDTYLGSLERIRDLDAATLFAGHGFPFIHPRKGVQRVIDHRLMREERVWEALAESPRSTEEIARDAYADTPGANPGLAATQCAVHLDRLERAGRASHAGGGWVRRG